MNGTTPKDKPLLVGRQWLREYIANGSAEAFSKLVALHVDLVYSSALRQTRGDRHMAEDVTQAAFLVLATRAATLHDDAPIAAWLLVVTRFAARNALKDQSRRRRHERNAAADSKTVTTTMERSAALSATGNGSPGWDEIAPELDEALGSLREKDRRAVVLRYLQGHSIEEVASLTGATPTAAKQRLHRSIERLRTFFRKRGVSGVSAAALGPMMLRHAVQPAPPGLTQGIISAVSSAVWASVSGSAIAKGVVLTMAWTKVKVAVVGAAALLVLGGGTAVMVNAWHPPAEKTVLLHRPADGVAPPPVTTVADLPTPDNEAAFLKAYSLAPGQATKFIPRPFPPGRSPYIKRTGLSARLSNAMNDAPMTFKWDGTLKWQSASFDESMHLPVETGAGLQWWDYEDPEKLVDSPSNGDWVFRQDASREQILGDVANVLTRRLNRTVRFEKQTKNREVIVVTGNFDPGQLAKLPRGEIVLGAKASSDQQTGEPRRDRLGFVLDRLGWKLHRQIINRSSGTEASVPWRENTDRLSEADVSRMLASLGDQLGLTFKLETRISDVWMVSADKEWRRRFDAVYGLKPGETLKRVAPPFIPERATFWGAEQRRLSAQPDMVTLQSHPSISVEYDAFGMPHWTSIAGDRTVQNVVVGTVNDLQSWEVDAGAVRDVVLPGDWVTREGATAGQQLADLSVILTSVLAHPVHFERRRVPREVIVAHSTYHFTPLQSNDAVPDLIDLYDADAPGNAKPVMRQGTLGEILNVLQPRLQRRIVDETNSSSQRVKWKDHMYTNAPLVLLANVAKQTGLRFDRETRDVDLWLLVGRDGSPYDGPAPTTWRAAQ